MKSKSLRIFAMTLMGLAMTLATAAFAVDTQTTIYNFQNKATVANPESGVIADAAGNLFAEKLLGRQRYTLERGLDHIRLGEFCVSGTRLRAATAAESRGQTKRNVPIN